MKLAPLDSKAARQKQRAETDALLADSAAVLAQCEIFKLQCEFRQAEVRQVKARLARKAP